MPGTIAASSPAHSSPGTPVSQQKPHSLAESPLRAILLLLISLIVGGIILSSSAHLSVVEELVRPQIENSLSEKILQQIRAESSFLSPQELAREVDLRTKAALTKAETIKKLNLATESNKKYFQNPQGDPYLLEPDAYYYFRYAQNIVKRGHPGETLLDGTPTDTLRNAPFGLEATWSLLPEIEARWYQFYSLFSSQTSLLRATFFLPVALGILSIALIFALGYVIFQRVEIAFFASLLFASHPTFFRQNMAGLSDTPILIMPLSLAFFLCVLLTFTGKPWQRILFLLCALLCLAALKYTWNGWFFVLGILAVFLVVYACVTLAKNPTGKKEKLLIFALAVVGLLLFLFMLRAGYVQRVLSKLQFTEDISGIQTSVKELQTPTLAILIDFLGKSLFCILLLISFGWFLLNITRKQATPPHLFLLVWFIVLLFPALRVLRFTFFLMPAAVILVAWCLDRFYVTLISLTADLRITSRFTATLILLFLVPGLVAATMIDTHMSKLSLMNSAVADTGIFLQQNTSANTIINTWWDRGYIWEVAAHRPTLLDAGPGSVTPWMAKALLSTDENYSRAVLRMLDCSRLKAYGTLKKQVGLNSTLVLDTLLHQSREEAEQTLASAKLAETINLTHCTPFESYVIVDQKMLNSIITISSLALWDERLALINEQTKNLSPADATSLIEQSFGINPDDAGQLLIDAREQTILTPDRRISATSTCTLLNATQLNCLGAQIDLGTLNLSASTLPSRVLLFKDGTRRERDIIDNNELALVVFFDKNIYRAFLISPDYTDTLLVRLFVQDRLDRFTFAHQASSPERIMTWKINWNDEPPRTNHSDRAPNAPGSQ